MTRAQSLTRRPDYSPGISLSVSHPTSPLPPSRHRMKRDAARLRIRISAHETEHRVTGQHTHPESHVRRLGRGLHDGIYERRRRSPGRLLHRGSLRTGHRHPFPSSRHEIIVRRTFRRSGDERRRHPFHTVAGRMRRHDHKDPCHQNIPARMEKECPVSSGAPGLAPASRRHGPDPGPRSPGPAQVSDVCRRWRFSRDR